MSTTFSEIITDPEEIHAVIGHPSQLVLDKSLPALDEHCQAFISKSPFLLIATADANGHMDVSPKGDPPGFVQILDNQTLAIPDRIGNRRIDTMRNILQNPRVGLIFLVPGKAETVRVNGSAMIVRDSWLRERMAVQGKLPNFAIVVKVEEAFLHCAKCMIRSHFWEPDQWPNIDDLASLARIIKDQIKLPQPIEVLEADMERGNRETLY